MFQFFFFFLKDSGVVYISAGSSSWYNIVASVSKFGPSATAFILSR